MLVERIMNKLKSLSIAQMVLPQRSLYRNRIPLFLSDIPVAVSNCRLCCHLLFALNPLSIHSLCFIKGLARPMSLYTPCRQEWLGRGTCLVNNICYNYSLRLLLFASAPQPTYSRAPKARLARPPFIALPRCRLSTQTYIDPAMTRTRQHPILSNTWTTIIPHRLPRQKPL